MALVQSPEPFEPLALMQIPADVLVRQVRDHAMFLIDRQGRVATWNEGVREVLGWEEADWIGQSVEVVFTPEDVAAGVPDREFRQAELDGRAEDSRWMLKVRVFTAKEASRPFARPTARCAPS
jgi:PAS domain-containing protein